uniref:Acyl-CoA thioesterase II domain-containing protein n=1 Tax=Trichuris muris TaxID=70415 RepID=A0A5S6Q7C6_TRIMR
MRLLTAFSKQFKPIRVDDSERKTMRILTGGLTTSFRRFCESMSKSLRLELVETFLNLDRVDANIYRSKHLIPGIPDNPRVYGGQVVGQAMVAATKTIDDAYHPHSLHCYFILGADRNMPIIYSVERVRDGNSFCTRFVKAIQNGANIFTCEISFQKDEKQWISHQGAMPKVPRPESLRSIGELVSQEIKNDPSYAERVECLRRMEHLPTTFDIRPVEPAKYLRKAATEATYMCWVKAKEPIGEDSRLHLCTAAFISDSCMVSTALLPHVGKNFSLAMAVSLDHSMWFHQNKFCMDEWMLYETDSRVAANSRALINGRMWSGDGQLVLSTAQEALIRGKVPRSFVRFPTSGSSFLNTINQESCFIGTIILGDHHSFCRFENLDQPLHAGLLLVSSDGDELRN